MKEIKWMLYTLYVAGYTSLIWGSAIWKGIQVGPNNVPVGLIFGAILTVVNVAAILGYLKKHWWESEIGR